MALNSQSEISKEDPPRFRFGKRELFICLGLICLCLMYLCVYYFLQSMPVPGRNLLQASNVGNPQQVMTATTATICPENQNNNTRKDEPLPLFSKALSNFDWETLLDNVKNENSPGVTAAQQELIQMLQNYVIVEPKIPIVAECKPPPLINVTKEVCSSPAYGSNAFTGEVNPNPPKVGILIQFGFHVDELEIFLNEVDDTIDRFFIAESTSTYFRGVRKGLIWEKVKYQERFRKFLDKIVHFVIDDADNSKVQLTNSRGKYDLKTYEMEQNQEIKKWAKFLEWNENHKFFGENDLLGFGDADEIPARRSIQLLKYCSLKSPIVDVGIWFPYGNLKYAYRSDWPVPGLPYTLGDPTFFTLHAAKHFNGNPPYPDHQRGRSNSFVLGGIHLTHSRYLPVRLLKLFSSTDSFANRTIIEKIVSRIRASELAELEEDLGKVDESFMPRIKLLNEIRQQMTEIAILPWFYSCNQQRYPIWTGKHDNRLD